MITDIKQIGEHETKFTLANWRTAVLWSWLSRRCLPDPEFSEGLVSSIYFDTAGFDMLDEKHNSTYLKTKVRLRWYSSITDRKPFPTTFLEVKKKVGSARIKRRIKMNFGSDAVLSHDLGNTFYLAMNRLLQEHGFHFNTPLYPAFQINYRRSRYIDPISGARLSLDRDINASRVNRKMVSQVNGKVLDEAVFEFKEKTGMLPDWLSQVTALSECRKGSFSKYSACYAQLLQIHY